MPFTSLRHLALALAAGKKARGNAGPHDPAHEKERVMKASASSKRAFAEMTGTYRVFQVLVGTDSDALLLRSCERLGAEAGDALGKAPLNETVEHAQRVLQLHLLEPLQHLCDEAERAPQENVVQARLQYQTRFQGGTVSARTCPLLRRGVLHVLHEGLHGWKALGRRSPGGVAILGGLHVNRHAAAKHRSHVPQVFSNTIRAS